MDSLAEKRERVKKLRPIDDVFFEVLADDLEVCQEILRTILKDDRLIVGKVSTAGCPVYTWGWQSMRY